MKNQLLSVNIESKDKPFILQYKNKFFLPVGVTPPPNICNYTTISMLKWVKYIEPPYKLL